MENSQDRLDHDEADKEVRTDERIELDGFGCRVVKELPERYLRHSLLIETWDGSDAMRVLPTAIPPSRVYSARFVQLLKDLKVGNMKPLPLTKGYGL